MKVYVGGAEGYTNQVDRIRQGLIDLGCTITYCDSDADLIYVNNPPFSPLFKDTKAIKIFNVLDIPEHLFPFFNVEDLKNQLSQADAITSISEFTAYQVKTHLGLDSTVIYNPIKPVYTINDFDRSGNRFLYVGRANDNNKRFYLIKEVLRLLKIEESMLKVCGSENPRFGDYQAVVTDAELNLRYNESDFIFLPSKIEGIGLPAIEGAICGAVPICCSDNLTAKEFFPYIDFPNPDPESIANYISEEIKTGNIRRKLLKHTDELLEMFSQRNVAKRILDVYFNIKEQRG